MKVDLIIFNSVILYQELLPLLQITKTFCLLLMINKLLSWIFLISECKMLVWLVHFKVMQPEQLQIGMTWLSQKTHLFSSLKLVTVLKNGISQLFQIPISEEIILFTMICKLVFNLMLILLTLKMISSLFQLITLIKSPFYWFIALTIIVILVFFMFIKMPTPQLITTSLQLTITTLV